MCVLTIPWANKLFELFTHWFSHNAHLLCQCNLVCRCRTLFWGEVCCELCTLHCWHKEIWPGRDLCIFLASRIACLDSLCLLYIQPLVLELLWQKEKENFTMQALAWKGKQMCCAYFCCKLSHMDFLCSQSYTRILLCGFLLCSQHWWSSLHKGLHIFHSCMPSNRHIQGLRDIHIACIFHRGCLCSLACTCRLLCGSWHYIQHSGHNFQKCKGPSILCCSKLLWWDTHHQTCSRLYWKKEERAFKSTAQGPNY